MKIPVMRKGRRRGLLLAMSMLVLLWGGLAFASSGGIARRCARQKSRQRAGCPQIPTAF